MNSENVRHSGRWECQTFSELRMPDILDFFSTSKFDNLHTIRCEIIWWHWILYQIWELTILQRDVKGFRELRECQTFSELRIPDFVDFFSTSKFDNLHTIRCEIVWWHWILYQIWELTILQGDIKVFLKLRECQTFSTFRMSDILDSQNVRHSRLSECLTFSTFRMSDILNFQNVWHSQLRECQTFSTCRMHDYLA